MSEKETDLAIAAELSDGSDDETMFDQDDFPRYGGLAEDSFYHYILGICEDRIRHHGSKAGDVYSSPGDGESVDDADGGSNDLFEAELEKWRRWVLTLSSVESSRAAIVRASVSWLDYGRNMPDVDGGSS